MEYIGTCKFCKQFPNWREHSMPTIKDIAKAAGVSHGTVSNVLNKRGNVSYEKIRLVEETARAMGYSLDEKASQLRRGSANIVALLLPTLEETRYVDLYLGVLRAVETRGFSVRLFQTNDMPYLERQAIAEAIACKACAVLAVSCLPSLDDYAPLSARNTKILFFERPPADQRFPSYLFDSQEITEYITGMVGQQHPLPEALCLVMDDARPDQQNLKGLLLKRLSIPPERIIHCSRRDPSGFLQAFNTLSPVPTHVICLEEWTALLLERHMPLRLYTLSSLRTLTPTASAQAALNYRAMGCDGANAVLNSVESNAALASRVFSVARSVLPPAFPMVKKEALLHILSHNTPTMEALRCLLPRFEQRTGIRIDLNLRSLNDALAEMYAPSFPQWDVIRLDPTNLSYFGPNKLFPLQEIDPHFQDAFSHLLPDLEKEYVLVNGVSCAVPFDIAVQMLFYQKSLFENVGQIRAYYELTGDELAIPRTYRQFDHIVRFFSQNYRKDSPVPYGSTMALSRPSSMAVEYLPRLLEKGKDAYDASGQLLLQSDAGLQALKEYMQFAQYVNPHPRLSWSQHAQDFINDRIATTIIFSNHASHFISSQSINTSMEIGFAPLPGGHPLIGGGTLAVGRESAPHGSIRIHPLGHQRRYCARIGHAGRHVRLPQRL